MKLLLGSGPQYLSGKALAAGCPAKKPAASALPLTIKSAGFEMLSRLGQSPEQI